MLKVAITGGAGYLGRGFLRRIHTGGLDWSPTVISRDEAKHSRVLARYPGTRIVRADVSESVDNLTRIFTGHDIVIHAAANKLVDIGELHAWEVVKNNIIGSRNVAEAAARAGVGQVIGISSDKAVQPVNVYGMTKSVMERLFQEADSWGDTQFTCARYGNVVGSTISIATYFREQLERDGFIQVTNPAMSRYYFGVDSAIDLVVWTLTYAQRGSVAIPSDMKAMTVADFAAVALEKTWKDAAEMADDPQVYVIGERPGEKLHEALLHEQESVRVLPYGSWTGFPGEVHQPYQLRPPGEVVRQRSNAFSLSSACPSGGWMTGPEMLALVQDSLSV